METVVELVTELVTVEQERALAQGWAKVLHWEDTCLAGKCLDNPDPGTTHHNIVVVPLE